MAANFDWRGYEAAQATAHPANGAGPYSPDFPAFAAEDFKAYVRHMREGADDAAEVDIADGGVAFFENERPSLAEITLAAAPPAGAEVFFTLENMAGRVETNLEQGLNGTDANLQNAYGVAFAFVAAVHNHGAGGTAPHSTGGIDQTARNEAQAAQATADAIVADAALPAALPEQIPADSTLRKQSPSIRAVVTRFLTMAASLAGLSQRVNTAEANAERALAAAQAAGAASDADLPAALPEPSAAQRTTAPSIRAVVARFTAVVGSITTNATAIAKNLASINALKAAGRQVVGAAVLAWQNGLRAIHAAGAYVFHSPWDGLFGAPSGATTATAIKAGTLAGGTIGRGPNFGNLPTILITTPLNQIHKVLILKNLKGADGVLVWLRVTNADGTTSDLPFFERGVGVDGVTRYFFRNLDGAQNGGANTEHGH